MDILVDEDTLREILMKAARYDIIIDALIRNSIPNVDLGSDWEIMEATLHDLESVDPRKEVAEKNKKAMDKKNQELRDYITKIDEQLNDSIDTGYNWLKNAKTE